MDECGKESLLRMDACYVDRKKALGKEIWMSVGKNHRWGWMPAMSM